MAKCRHRNRKCYGWHRADHGWREAPYLAPYQAAAVRCEDCGAWLPLGPSNDDSPEVQIEKMAAKMAADTGDEECPSPDRWSFLACTGWYMHMFGNEPRRDEEWVGYLARVIARHEEVRDGDA